MLVMWGLGGWGTLGGRRALRSVGPLRGARLRGLRVRELRRYGRARARWWRLWKRLREAVLEA